MRVTVIGIDPGINGAVALLSNDPQTCMFWPLSDFVSRPTSFEDMTEQYAVHHVYIEKSQAFPGGQGVVSMFNYGTGFGRLLGWCEMLGLPFTLVPPRTWTREMHMGCTGKDAKEKSLQAVLRLFPQEDLKERGRKPHLGIVDALLIAEYGRRIYK